jgi:phage tail sheath protein FI
MTEDDIDHGRINLTIGFAPLKPSEFVVLRIATHADPAAGGSS